MSALPFISFSKGSIIEGIFRWQSLFFPITDSSVSSSFFFPGNDHVTSSDFFTYKTNPFPPLTVVFFRPCKEGRLSVVHCCYGPFNSFVADGLFLLEIIIVSLQPFFLGVLMSDGRRNSSFMSHNVGREIAGVIMGTMDA